MEITAALSSAKTAFELARALQNGLARQQIKLEEVPARLMELQQHILSMQAILHDLAEENRRLSTSLDEANKSADLRADMEFVVDGGFYVRKTERDRGAIIPYCPLCWQVNGRTVPLERQRIPGDYWCAVHTNRYRTNAATAAEEREMKSRSERRRDQY